MKESRSYEVKESITNTFLKTVSAYANYGDGVIEFGIADDGTVVGIHVTLDTYTDVFKSMNNDAINKFDAHLDMM